MTGKRFGLNREDTIYSDSSKFQSYILQNVHELKKHLYGKKSRLTTNKKEMFHSHFLLKTNIYFE